MAGVTQVGQVVGEADTQRPTYEDVVGQFDVLKRDVGLTDRKLQDADSALMRLDISQDEYRRHNCAVPLPRATIAALQCVANSYQQSYPDKQDRWNKERRQEDLRSMVLRYELNLDQSMPHRLTDRQEDAQTDAGLGRTAYKAAAASILGQYAWDVWTLRQSRCRSADDWKREQQALLDSLSRRQRDQLLQLVLNNYPDAWTGSVDDALDLRIILPSLMALLDLYRVPPPENPRRIILETVVSTAGLLFDDFAKQVITEEPEILALPWEQCRPFILGFDWVAEEAYREAAKNCDVTLVIASVGIRLGQSGNGLAWSLPLSTEAKKQMDETGRLFFGEDETPTDAFLIALDGSRKLLTRLILSIDDSDTWGSLQMVRQIRDKLQPSKLPDY